MRRSLLAALLLGGCYDPHPPSGSYLCGAAASDAGTGSCPAGQSCVKGQCVDHDSDAVYSFAITVMGTDASDSIKVGEHQPFTVQIDALKSDGSAASSFDGTVTLSSTWGDVCVGTSGCVTSPDTVQLTNGTATATIQLNRETNAPQTAILRATFAGAVGSSGATQISVAKPVAALDADPIAAPLTIGPNSTFGFAKYAVGAPFVVKDSSGWTLYFEGGLPVGTGTQVTTGAGLATSMDGIHFTPQSSPLFSPTLNGGTAVPATQFGALSAYATPKGVSLFFGLGAQSNGFAAIERSDAATSIGPFSEAGTTALALPAGYAAIDTPVVIADPAPALSGGGPSSAVMYFSAITADTSKLLVLRAVATDGVTFEVEASPVLDTTTGEGFVIGPRVLVDGHTYKMWYSYVASMESPTSAGFGCDLGARYNIGYATSSDGYFWVRSASNISAPTIGATSAKVSSVLMGSAIATDGVDPSKGISLYYSPMALVGGGCLPNGISRAVLNGAP